jgi:predicted hotdog family 3-hydroxylacyl-ACP dehydratase
MAPDTLIPHKGPMLLVNDLIELDPGQKKGRVSSILAKGKPYWNESESFRYHWLLEIMAQAAATVCGALRGSNHEAAAPGFLLSIREWSLLQRPPLAPGAAMLAEVTIETEMDALSQASITLEYQGETVARSMMSFYQEARRPVS